MPFTIDRQQSQNFHAITVLSVYIKQIQNEVKAGGHKI